jgi:hypothetical protein
MKSDHSAGKKTHRTYTVMDEGENRESPSHFLWVGKKGKRNSNAGLIC